MTHEYVFDLKEDDIFWCSADVGWITGHSYIAYGPLVNGCTQVVLKVYQRIQRRVVWVK